MSSHERFEWPICKPARSVLASLFLSLSLAIAPGPCFAQGGPHGYGGMRSGMGPRGSQPHLGAWLQRHQGLSSPQQERALQREPGFNRLPPQVQQRLMGRLHQIDSMSPQQRQRTLDRIEALERLTPQKRQQVHASVQEFRTLPPGEQRLVRKAFRDLSVYPPQQRQAMMGSAQFQGQFNPEERGILRNILSVEPVHSGPPPGGAPPPAPPFRR